MHLLKHTKSRESSNAIERMYITMRHLFNRGFYKPMGISGQTLRDALLVLKPEIYGSIAEEKAELDGLVYVLERLPEGIEECRFINLTAEEGYHNSHFKPLIPEKRRRNCYRIDRDQMNIVITRGRSDVYDILTHLTFLFIESHKIKHNAIIDEEGKAIREWENLEEVVLNNKKLSHNEKEIVITHVANILGRTFSEVKDITNKFDREGRENRFFSTIYWMGKLAINETFFNKKRTIIFSSTLRERIGHHIYGEKWAEKIKTILFEKGIFNRPLHIISANMHSVMNRIYGPIVLQEEYKKHKKTGLFEKLSKKENNALQSKIKNAAANQGLTYVKDTSGTNINVQIIDTAHIDRNKLDFLKNANTQKNTKEPILIVMDYAFGEQAFETMDELLKPYICPKGKTHFMPVVSVSVMGKAGILKGKKGDIMIPTAHIYEGTADNYPFKNELNKVDFEDSGIDAYEGTMVTVLGTSLQNRDLLEFFHNSTWRAIGLEMEGAHYQKAIQSASQIRGNISKDVKVRYAYYASDNPLETGGTLASGGLGTTGVKPTYTITEKILEQIFNQ
ncbi:MAG: hypothetical protein CSA39_02160 [Flavobacteriales bacterium]|nr:MAG: hypothetical protein CSA39_02160 [Flavobacteriales bacterium]